MEWEREGERGEQEYKRVGLMMMIHASYICILVGYDGVAFNREIIGKFKPTDVSPTHIGLTDAYIWNEWSDTHMCISFYSISPIQ